MCGFRRSKAMTNKQAEVMRLYRQGLSTCEIAQRLGVTKGNVRYLRAAANGKKPKSTYRYREPCTVCPYCASCFRCPLPDCVIPSRQIVNLLPEGFTYRPDD